jgi:hypothetical protein
LCVILVIYQESHLLYANVFLEITRSAQGGQESDSNPGCCKSFSFYSSRTVVRTVVLTHHGFPPVMMLTCVQFRDQGFMEVQLHCHILSWRGVPEYLKSRLCQLLVSNITQLCIGLLILSTSAKVFGSYFSCNFCFSFF